MRKKIFLLSLLIFLSTLQNQAVDKGLLKKIGIGIPAIILSYYLTDYATVTIHELGHATANKIINGMPINFTIFSSGNPIIPWTGYTITHQRIDPVTHRLINPLASLIITLSGPLMGFLATKALFFSLEYYLRKKKKRSLRKIIKRTLWQPLTTFQDFGKVTAKGKQIDLTEFIILGLSICTSLRFMNSITDVIPNNNPHSDGTRLWNLLHEIKARYFSTRTS